MWRALALLCFTVLGAAAQTVINAESGPWTASLDGTWRWHPGDDLRWASTTFDDSNWPALRVPGPVPQSRPYWIRLHVQIGPTSDPGLMLGPFANAYQTYWDGQFIGSFGDLARGEWFVPRWETFHLHRDLKRSGIHSIAIRVGQIGQRGPTRQPRLHAGDNRIGDFSALHETESALMRADLHPRMFQLLLDFGFVLAGLYFLLLPPLVSQGAAFRWLGLILLGPGLSVMMQFYRNDAPLNMPSDLVESLIWIFNMSAIIGTVEFPFALFRRRVPVSVRWFEGFVALFMLQVSFEPLARSIVVLSAALVPVGLAGAELRKRTADAGLTLVLFVFFAAAAVHGTLAVIFHWPFAVYVAGSRLTPTDLAFLLWIPAISRQIHKTNLRFRDERERLLGEMEAAQRVQEILLPSRAPDVPGFEIEATYQPATEVGGDFFQLFAASNDSLLVVVGDVSGKGMKAALLVSVIVGALQNRKSDQPAEVLRELNAVLLGRSEGGFTTCCCALFSSDGTLTIANAGHLAPYRNGSEIPTRPGLPLGVVRDASWEETRIELQPSDRMLWISDGVVEARNGKRDLLGFERAQELATRSASEIAQAAQQFGQDDDITVVSITRQAVAAYVA